MPEPAPKKRKLNGVVVLCSNADNLYSTDPYNVERWMHIINRADRDGTIDDQRYILNIFLSIFPTSARQWKYYIEIEMHHGHYQIAIELFKKCINNKCYDVSLYIVYIELCRKINELSSKDIYLSNLIEAYRFAVKQVGQDIASTNLWRKYLNFLKINNLSLNNKHNIKDITLEIRKIYQMVIQLPIDECDKLWDEYILWEKSLNPQLAQAWYDKFKHLHELTKQCYLDRKRWKRGILLNIHTVPSNNKHAQERNYQQIQLWKRFIEFELLNKQNLNKTDLWRRMEFTFRQSLMTMSLFPDIWLMYIQWTIKNRGIKRTQNVYQQSIQRIPNCLLIQFKYLEFLEKHKDIKEADEAYINLLQEMPNNTLIYIQYLYFLRRCKSTTAARNFFIQTISSSTNKFWQLYVAEGSIEEYINNDGACAQRIFQNGFKYFSDKPEFVICYVQFLMNKKDQNSKNQLRQIFDTILPTLNPKNKETQQIWKLYIKFEQRSCSLNELHDVEDKRNREQHCNRIEMLLNSIDRFSFLDLLPVSKQYRDTLIHAKQTSQKQKKVKPQQMITQKLLNNNNNNNNKKNISSGIKINNILDIIDNNNNNNNNNDNNIDIDTPFVDMTTFINDNSQFSNITNNKDSNITMPDLSQLIAFRPGIRFLQKLNNDDMDNNNNNNKKEKDDDNEDDDIKLKESLPPKIKELLNKLPPPQHTQLLKLDKNTSMIDVESFLTFMKLQIIQ